VASGTATLETLLVGRPMVVAYRASPLTYAVATGLKLVKVRYFSLPNLLADAPLVPELLQHEVTPAALADAAAGLLAAPQRLAELQRHFTAIGASLRRGASAQAAQAVLEVANLG
jgi:lipid-A-disaccharide synthase